MKPRYVEAVQWQDWQSPGKFPYWLIEAIKKDKIRHYESILGTGDSDACKVYSELGQDWHMCSRGEWIVLTAKGEFQVWGDTAFRDTWEPVPLTEGE